MIVLLDIDNHDDETIEFRDCPSEEDPTTRVTCLNYSPFQALALVTNAHARLTISLQAYTLIGSFLLLNIPGYNLILGVEWLESLGYIGWHFWNKTMLFTVNNKTCTLQGLITAQPTFLPCNSAQSGFHYPSPILTADYPNHNPFVPPPNSLAETFTTPLSSYLPATINIPPQPFPTNMHFTSPPIPILQSHLC